MFTYIKNHQLLVLNPTTGKIYRIHLSSNEQDLVVILDEILSFQADVDKCIIDNKATLIND